MSRDCLKGIIETHEMIFDTANFLAKGEDIKIITPLDMVLRRKPESS